MIGWILVLTRQVTWRDSLNESFGLEPSPMEENSLMADLRKRDRRLRRIRSRTFPFGFFNWHICQCEIERLIKERKELLKK